MNILQQTPNSPQRQMQREVVELGREQLRRHAERRTAIADRQEWEQQRSELMQVIRSAFPEMTTTRRTGLRSRLVSSHEAEHFRIENVVFDSYPGWEVNATVYLPKEPGIYPGVVCPTGHSSKIYRNYQGSAQVFARNGYVAVSFDPPGCAGEIKHMNDHFTNGLIGYLTGIWSNFHFVYDAIACIDYLETREDVDTSPGVTMTGVSGGGCTSIYASLLDERIAFVAPSSCLVDHETLHFTDLYTSCPEQFGPGFIKAGIDFSDLIALQAPKPCLIIGGQLDDLFDYRKTTALHQEAAAIYRLYGAEQELGLFLQEDDGHAYSVVMASETVRWMNRLIKGNNEPALPLTADDVQMLSPELLKCSPSNAVNMFTINREEGRRLADGRTIPAGEAGASYVRDQVARLLDLDEKLTAGDAPATDVQTNVELWPTVRDHQFEAIVLQRGTEDAPLLIPGLLLKRVRSQLQPVTYGPKPALLYIDEEGKWQGYGKSCVLSHVVDYINHEGQDDEPIVYSIDVSGKGELSPQPVPYDMAPWNDIERILTYLSVAEGRPLIGLQVRDALVAWHYLRNRADVDPTRMSLAGRGVGAIIAQLVAVFAGPLERLIVWDGLARYQALTESFPFNWPQSVILPDILKYLDLPDLHQSIDCKRTLLINPRDAARAPLDQEQARLLYAGATEVCSGLGEIEARQKFIDWARS